MSCGLRYYIICFLLFAAVPTSCMTVDVSRICHDGNQEPCESNKAIVPYVKPPIAKPAYFKHFKSRKQASN